MSQQKNALRKAGADLLRALTSEPTTVKAMVASGRLPKANITAVMGAVNSDTRNKWEGKEGASGYQATDAGRSLLGMGWATASSKIPFKYAITAKGTSTLDAYDKADADAKADAKADDKTTAKAS